MFTLFSLPITVSGVPVSNGSIVITLVGGPATIISTGGAAPSSYTFNLDANGNPPATMQVWGNQELSPAGTNYNYAVYSGANGTGSVVIGPFTSIIGPSAPYSGTLYPNLTVLPLISAGAINGVSVSGTPSANSIIVATGGTAAIWKASTGTGNGVLQTNPNFNQAASAGAAITIGNSGLGYTDGSSGTAGQGGYVNFTNDASAVTGYGTWITNNAFFNGTNWIQARGTGTSSSGFTANHHKGFSFNRAAAIGTNNTAITWTEVVNISSAGSVLIPSTQGFAFSSGNTGTSLPAADTIISRIAANQVGIGSAVGNTSGTLLARTLGITGSTSGTTSLVTDAAASGTVTVKAGTYNVVGDSLTQTLTNKNLTTPTISSPVITGTVTSYNGATTSGNGIGAVVGTPVDFNGTTATSGTLVASTQAGTYLVFITPFSFGIQGGASGGTFVFTLAGSNIFVSPNPGPSTSTTVFYPIAPGGGQTIKCFGGVPVIMSAGASLTYSTSFTGTASWVTGAGNIIFSIRTMFIG